MRIDVAFTPAQLQAVEQRVCIVIDVLRATSTLVTMFGRGLEEALVAETIDDARDLAKRRPDHLLCGERNSLPPDGFDHGNSPSEFDKLDLTGRRAILATTNGTRAMRAATASPVLLAGALLNLSAASARAREEAQARELDITVVCSGLEYGSSFSLEDTYCAGGVVDCLLAGTHGKPLAGDEAIAAQQMFRSYHGSARTAFDGASHARALFEVGLGQDLDFCADVDKFRVVPRLTLGEDGLLRATAADNSG